MAETLPTEEKPERGIDIWSLDKLNGEYRAEAKREVTGYYMSDAQWRRWWENVVRRAADG